MILKLIKLPIEVTTPAEQLLFIVHHFKAFELKQSLLAFPSFLCLQTLYFAEEPKESVQELKHVNYFRLLEAEAEEQVLLSLLVSIDSQAQVSFVLVVIPIPLVLVWVFMLPSSFYLFS